MPKPVQCPSCGWEEWVQRSEPSSPHCSSGWTVWEMIWQSCRGHVVTSRDYLAVVTWWLTWVRCWWAVWHMTAYDWRPVTLTPVFHSSQPVTSAKERTVHMYVCMCVCGVCVCVRARALHVNLSNGIKIAKLTWGISSQIGFQSNC